MRILVDLRLLTKGKTSGIEEYARFLIDEFLVQDKENQYQFFYNGLRKAPFPTKWRQAHTSLINWYIPNKLFDLSLRFLHQPKIEFFSDADLIYSPHFNLIRKKPETKRIITFHDLSFLHHPEWFPLRKRFWHWQQDCRRQAEEAFRIVAVSDFTRQDVIETFGVPPEKVTAIHSGVNPFYRPLPELKKDRPFLLYLGTIEPRKNIIGLIKAFNIIKSNKIFRDLELTVAGAKGWLYGRIFKEAGASPYRSAIKFTGPVSQEEARTLYNQAALFVYPSFFEGFGFPPLEAQACGLPVVASNQTALPEILSHSALLVNPADIEALAAAMESVLTSPSRQATLRQKGFENVRRFNWPKTAQQCLKLFQQKI